MTDIIPADMRARETTYWGLKPIIEVMSQLSDKSDRKG